MKWLRNIILSEADDDNEVDEPATTGVTDEQPEDSGEEDMSSDQTIDEPATTSDNDSSDSSDSEEEVTGANASDETVDEPATTSDDDSDEKEATDEDGETEEDGDEVTGEDSGEDSNTENENLKKLKLVDEYKELYDIIMSIKDSLNNLEGKIDQRKTQILDHTEKLVTHLISDITFVIANRFTEDDYKTLLTNFYQFKYQLNSVMRVIDYLVQDEVK